MSDEIGRRIFMKTVASAGASSRPGCRARDLLAAGNGAGQDQRRVFSRDEADDDRQGRRLVREAGGGQDQLERGRPAAPRSTPAIAAKASISASPLARRRPRRGSANNIPFQVVGLVDNIGPAEDMVVRKAANIKTPADFKGKKVATPFGSTSHFRLLGFLKTNGLTEKDVTVLDLKADAAVAAWTRGDIDAGYYLEPVQGEDARGRWRVLPDLEEARRSGLRHRRRHHRAHRVRQGISGRRDGLPERLRQRPHDVQDQARRRSGDRRQAGRRYPRSREARHGRVRLRHLRAPALGGLARRLPASPASSRRACRAPPSS